MVSGSGWNLWVWLAGGCGWNLWVWLVGMVVRRYIDSSYYLSCICSFLFIFKMCFVLLPVLFVIIFIV